MTDAEVQAELDRHDWTKGGDGRYVAGAVWNIPIGLCDPSYYMVVLVTDNFILMPLGGFTSSSHEIGRNHDNKPVYLHEFTQEQLVRVLSGHTFIGSIQDSIKVRKLCVRAIRNLPPVPHKETA